MVIGCPLQIIWVSTGVHKWSTQEEANHPPPKTVCSTKLSQQNNMWILMNNLSHQYSAKDIPLKIFGLILKHLQFSENRFFLKNLPISGFYFKVIVIRSIRRNLLQERKFCVGKCEIILHWNIFWLWEILAGILLLLLTHYPKNIGQMVTL